MQVQVLGSYSLPHDVGGDLASFQPFMERRVQKGFPYNSEPKVPSIIHMARQMLTVFLFASFLLLSIYANPLPYFAQRLGRSAPIPRSQSLALLYKEPLSRFGTEDLSKTVTEAKKRVLRNPFCQLWCFSFCPSCFNGKK